MRYVHPVCRSIAAPAAGGFAAERRAGKRYPSVAASAVLQARRGAQQQMRVASHREQTEEAQHRLVNYWKELSPAATDRSISLAHRALSSKPAGRSIDGTDGRTDGRTPDRYIDPAPHTMRAMPLYNWGLLRGNIIICCVHFAALSATE